MCYHFKLGLTDRSSLQFTLPVKKKLSRSKLHKFAFSIKKASTSILVLAYCLSDYYFFFMCVLTITKFEFLFSSNMFPEWLNTLWLSSLSSHAPNSHYWSNWLLTEFDKRAAQPSDSVLTFTSHLFCYMLTINVDRKSALHAHDVHCTQTITKHKQPKYYLGFKALYVYYKYICVHTAERYKSVYFCFSLCMTPL